MSAGSLLRLEDLPVILLSAFWDQIDRSRRPAREAVLEAFNAVSANRLLRSACREQLVVRLARLANSVGASVPDLQREALAALQRATANRAAVLAILDEASRRGISSVVVLNSHELEDLDCQFETVEFLVEAPRVPAFSQVLNYIGYVADAPMSDVIRAGGCRTTYTRQTWEPVVRGSGSTRPWYCGVSFSPSRAVRINDVMGDIRPLEYDGCTAGWALSSSAQAWYLATLTYHRIMLAGIPAARHLGILVDILTQDALKLYWPGIVETSLRYRHHAGVYYVLAHVDRLLGSVPQWALAALSPSSAFPTRPHDWGDFMPRLLDRLLDQRLGGASQDLVDDGEIARERDWGLRGFTDYLFVREWQRCGYCRSTTDHAANYCPQCGKPFYAGPAAATPGVTL